MIFHASIDAHDPQRVGQALAELWRGEVLPFPPIGEGSVIVMAGDERNSAIEIYRRGTGLAPGKGDADAVGVATEPAGAVAVHLAIATPLEAEEVAALAREGWLAKRRRRGDLFDVIELWLENRLMVEALTPAMQTEYLQAMTMPNWRAAVQAPPPAA
jgi:hypothetical protein